MNNDDGRLPELIAKWKDKTKLEEEDVGKRGEEQKKKRCSCADVMKRVVEPVLKERADDLKGQGFRVEAGEDKTISEPSRLAYRFSFDYPGSPNVLINCDEENGTVLFTAKTVARSEVQRREGWDKHWEIDNLTNEELAKELRLFCEEVIEHLVLEPSVGETVQVGAGRSE
jgi:hypothetical protein